MEKIVYEGKIPSSNVGIKVDTTRKEIINLLDRVIADEGLRVEFNKDPRKMLEKSGIYLDPDGIEKLKGSPITSMISGMSGSEDAVNVIPLVAVVVGVVVVSLILPIKPAH